MKNFFYFALISWVALAPAFSTAQPTAGLIVKSTSFNEGETMPSKYTSEGQDISPQLSWENVPPGTVEFSLIMEDPDALAPIPWSHWVLYNIPKEVYSIPERGSAGLTGHNSWGRAAYTGPNPPKGTGAHRYRFTVYALREPISILSGLNREELIAAMQGKILAQGTLTGKYKR